jgi:succinoglycan biosynthesis transport protein ExoP
MNPKSQPIDHSILAVTSPAAIFAVPPKEITREILAPRHEAIKGPAAAATIDPMSLLNALRRRLTLALGMAILATGICGPAAWYFVPSGQFTANARLLIAAQAPKVLFRTVETEAGDDYHRFQTTQLTLIKSRNVLNAAIQDEKVTDFRLIRDQGDPIKWLQETLKVEFISASEVMEISMAGDIPAELAGLVNAVKKAYMEEVVYVDIKKRADRHDRLKKLKKTYDDMLKERRDSQRKLAETVGSDDRSTLALRQQYAMEHAAALRSELLDVQSQKRKAESLLKTRRPEANGYENTPPTVTEADIKQMVEQHPSVASLVEKLAKEEERSNSDLDHLRSIARKGAADPAHKALRDRLIATRKSLAKTRAEVRSSVLAQLENPDSSLRSKPGGEMDEQLAMLTNLEQSLIDQINRDNQGNHSLTVKTLDLQEIQTDVSQMEATALKVGAEVEALNVELEAPPRIRTIEDAVVPQTRSQKKRLTMIGAVIFGSFFAGLFAVAYLEMQTKKVESADDVPADLGLRVVGALPILPPRASRGGATARAEKDRYWQTLLLESIDATRTMLVHAAKTEGHRVVMIASAVSGEGKTSLSSHLATSLACSGSKVLLIDADLRRPSIHRIFDLPVGAGLSEVLRGEVAAADVINDTAVEDLKVLTAGYCDQKTIRILAQGGLGALFVQFKEQFDFVIVDSSPILPVADALIIAQQVDAVLFSVFRGVSRKTNASAAIQKLESLGVRIFGAVVTGGYGGLYGTYSGYDSKYAKLPPSAVSSAEARTEC